MALPLSATRVRLISGVPFTSDYKDTRWFANASAQLSYFNSFDNPFTGSDYTFQYENMETKTGAYITVKRNVEQLNHFNYLYFQNSQYGSKHFFAFIDRIVPASSQTTRVYFTIDVIQTWMFDIEFKESLVVREHATPQSLSSYVNPIDEGLDLGDMYDIKHVQNVKMNANIYFLIVVAKNAMHAGSDTGKVTPSLNGAPQPLTFYIIPFTRSNGDITVNVNGTEAPAVDKVDVVLKNLYTIEGAVNNIVALYVTDYFGQEVATENNVVNFNGNYGAVSVQDSTQTITIIHVEKLPQYQTAQIDLGNKYGGFENYGDNKLYMYPYCVTQLMDGVGNTVDIRNEFIKGNNLILNVRGSLGLAQKTSYAPNYYNYDVTTAFGNQIGILSSIINNEPNDVPIITDLLSAYLQGNRNSLKAQENSIMFNGAFGAINSGISAITGGLAGGAMGGAGGAIAGAVGGAMSGVQGVGNTILQLQAMEAKKADISNVPPNMTKQGSDTYYSTGYDYKGIYVVKKQIKPEYAERLAKYFKAFGYKTNKIKVPNLLNRQHWNYVQLLDPKINGKLNTEDMNKIKSIFTSGITLWHTNDIGNYSLANGGA